MHESKKKSEGPLPYETEIPPHSGRGWKCSEPVKKRANSCEPSSVTFDTQKIEICNW